jgi:prepilin-type N-terminal cleavage/methylation domain-containing protein
MMVAMRYKREKWTTTKEHLMNAACLDRRRLCRGLTLLEVLVVLGIIGIFMVVSYPSILNILAERDLDNATRQVQTLLQMTKHQAISTKVVHRVLFYQPEGTYWSYDMQRLQADGTWVKARANMPPRTIPAKLVVTLTFRTVSGGREASFSPLGTFPGEAIFNASGFFPAFDPTQNSITLQNPKLARLGQDDERVLTIFLGGSIQYDKKKSA